MKLVRDVKFIENEFPARDPGFYKEHFGDMKKIAMVENLQTQEVLEPDLTGVAANHRVFDSGEGPLGAQSVNIPATPQEPVQPES